jgi:hypothetical protein
MLMRSGTVVCAAMAAVTLGTSHAAAASSYRAHWKLDEIGSRTAQDSSGHGNDGTNHNVVGNGSGYTFNGKSSRVIVPNDSSLNPGSGDFSWGVTLSMTDPPGRRETYDVLRKGLAGGKGGDYKLEIKNASGKAKARCVFNSVLPNGKRANLAVAGAKSLADGKRHTIRCKKTSKTLTITIDATKSWTKRPASGLGTISNSYGLGLGAKAEKTAKSGFDWFKGKLFDAWVE